MAYQYQSRFMRERDSEPTQRSVGGPSRPRMDAIVGHKLIAPRPWRPMRWTANTNAKPLGGPGDMRIQGKRFESQWIEPTRRVYLSVDYQVCDGAGCGFRIDLRKHERIIKRNGETWCMKCVEADDAR